MYNFCWRDFCSFVFYLDRRGRRSLQTNDIFLINRQNFHKIFLKLTTLPPGGRCRVYEAEGARVQIRLLKKFCFRTILHLQTDKSNPKFLNHALSLSLLLRKIQLLHYASHNVQREPCHLCATFYFWIFYMAFSTVWNGNLTVAVFI